MEKFVITEEMRLPIAVAIVETASPSHNPLAAYYVCGGKDVLYLEDWEEIPDLSTAIKVQYVLWQYKTPHQYQPFPELNMFNVSSVKNGNYPSTPALVAGVYNPREERWEAAFQKAVDTALLYIKAGQELCILDPDDDCSVFFSMLEKIDRDIITASTLLAGIDANNDDDDDNDGSDYKSDPEVRLWEYISGLRNAREIVIKAHQRQRIYSAYTELNEAFTVLVYGHKHVDYYMLGWRQAMLLVASVLGIPVR